MDDTERKDVFPDEDLEPLLNWLKVVIAGILPNEIFDVSGTQNRKFIRIDVTFDNPNVVGLFMGHKRRAARHILGHSRFQQLHPHNRYLQLHVIKPDGSEDIINDRDVFTRKKA